MAQTVIISELIGNDLRTRSFFRRDMERVISGHSTDLILDFSGVSFISRSVADELYNLTLDYPRITIRDLKGDPASMFDIVVKGRTTPREYPSSKAKVFHLKTMKEMREFFPRFNLLPST